jgi:hypothetical protein
MLLPHFFELPQTQSHCPHHAEDLLAVKGLMLGTAVSEELFEGGSAFLIDEIELVAGAAVVLLRSVETPHEGQEVRRRMLLSKGQSGGKFCVVLGTEDGEGEKVILGESGAVADLLEGGVLLLKEQFEFILPTLRRFYYSHALLLLSLPLKLPTKSILHHNTLINQQINW